MQSFLEYLKEQKAKQLEEDAVMAADAAAADNAVVSPNVASTKVDSDISPPKAMVGMTDNSVLGGATKKKDKGFFGKGDFIIPKNVLSCGVEIRDKRI